MKTISAFSVAVLLLAASAPSFVAQPFEPAAFSEMRWRAIGPFRGGRTFEKVLSKDENTGGSDLEFDPKNPDIVYACLWEQRQGPWENGAWAGTHGGIFKSTDRGTTWKPLTRGLPAEGVVQADVAVAPSEPNRIY